MKKLIIYTILGSVLSTAAAADEFKGPRIGIGYAQVEGEILNTNQDLDAVKVEFGYDFNKIIGLSLSYTGASEEIEGIDVDSSSAKLGLDVGYTIPVQQFFIKPYVTGGVQRLEVEIEGYELADDSSLYYGIGTRFVYQNMYADISYMQTTIDTIIPEDLDYSETALTIGYKF